MPCHVKFKPFSHVLNLGAPHVYVSGDWVPEALANILDGLQDMRDDSALCHAIANHMDFAGLAARVAAVVQLRRKLDDHDLTATERDALERLAVDPCEWVRNEARGALDDLADPLPDQVAAHDGASDDSADLAELDFICLHGLTDKRHARLNWLRANGSQEVRARAGNLLISLAGVAND